jgi:cytochrome b subunit of formate dehydrogenase
MMGESIKYKSVVTGLVLLILFTADPSIAQKEVTSEIYRYQQKEVIMRQSGAHEVRPIISHSPTARVSIGRKKLIDISPTADKIKHRRYMTDSHLGLRFYQFRSCIDCHPQNASNLHRVRSKITCRQCHGEEPIAGTKHYYSSMHPIRRYAFVCAKCHKGANASFAAYVVHEPNPALKTTQKNFPLLFYVFWAMAAIAIGTFAVFLPHTLLWGLREFWPDKKDKTKRRKREKIQVQRFSKGQRAFHLILMLCFVIQSATGLSRMYAGTEWGYSLLSLFGGYTRAIFLHKIVGIFMLAAFAIHLVYIIKKINFKDFPNCFLGPDSLLPRIEDAIQAFRHTAWIVGLRKCPKFDRWTYWEKFDYWAVFWGINILGITGLILYSPVFTSRFIPGWTINVFLWIHRIEAVLAMGHVFIIHFFIGHLRRHHFPMDLTMFEGSVDIQELHHERPAWIERLKNNKALHNLMIKRVSMSQRYFYYLFGFAIIALCLYLLINTILNGGELTRILLNKGV